MAEAESPQPARRRPRPRRTPSDPAAPKPRPRTRARTAVPRPAEPAPAEVDVEAPVEVPVEAPAAVEAPPSPEPVSAREPEPALEAAPNSTVAPAAVEAPVVGPRTAYAVLWGSGLVNVLALLRRDVVALFLSPLAPAAGVAVVVPAAVLGLLVPVFGGGLATMDAVFTAIALALAFLAPVVAMRLLTEEDRSGMLELLLASPVRVWEVVVAKWLAGLALLLAATAFTLVDAALLAAHDPLFDGRAVAGGYLGVVLVAAAWMAVALLAAGLTRHPLAAVGLGVAALVGLQYLLDAAAAQMAPPLSDVLAYASAAGHARSFAHGQLVLRDVLYFVTLVAGALFVAVPVLGSRRWR